MKKFLAVILFVTIVFCTGCEGGANETKQSSEAARDVVDPYVGDEPEFHEQALDPYVGDEPEFHEQVLDVPDPEDAVNPEEQPDLIVEHPGDVEPFLPDESGDENAPEETTTESESAEGVFLDDRYDIPIEDFKTMIDTLVVEDGTYIICGGKAAFCQEGRETYSWESVTYFDDFLFQIDGEVYARMGGRIVHFVDADMFIMAEVVAECQWTGTDFYCYYFVGDGELHFWSPTNDCYIASGVNYVRTTNGHTFYESQDGDIYVLNADPFAIMRVSSDYVYAHPVPVVRLGEGPMSTYSDRLISYGEENERKAATDFDPYFGLDRSAGGDD